MQRARSFEKKQIKLNLIKSKSSELFLNQKNSMPSVNDITRACNLSKGAIYTYFDSKEEIFLSILNDEFQNWFEIIKIEITNSNDFKLLLDKIFNPLFNNILFLELASRFVNEIESNCSQNIIIDYHNKMGKNLKTLTNHIGMKFNLSSELILKNFMESLTTIIGSYQISSNARLGLRSNVSYAFLFPDFQLHGKNILRKIWQY